MVTLVSFIVAALVLTIVFSVGWFLGLRKRSHQQSLPEEIDLRSLHASLERLKEQVALVGAPTPSALTDDIPDGIVHDDVRQQLRWLAHKWGVTPQMVLRCAVTFQVLKIWKDELEDTGPESGEVHLNVSTAVDDTGDMFRPGYAEEISEEPTAAEDDDEEDDPVSARPLPRKPTKH